VSHYDFSLLPDQPKPQYDFSALPDQPKPAPDADPWGQQSSEGAVGTQDLKPTLIRDLTRAMLDDAGNLFPGAGTTPNVDSLESVLARLSDSPEDDTIKNPRCDVTNTGKDIYADASVLESTNPAQINSVPE
jgi:hypothetical protein